MGVGQISQAWNSGFPSALAGTAPSSPSEIDRALMRWGTQNFVHRRPVRSEGRMCWEGGTKGFISDTRDVGTHGLQYIHIYIYYIYIYIYHYLYYIVYITKSWESGVSKIFSSPNPGKCSFNLPP